MSHHYVFITGLQCCLWWWHQGVFDVFHWISITMYHWTYSIYHIRVAGFAVSYRTLRLHGRGRYPSVSETRKNLRICSDSHEHAFETRNTYISDLSKYLAFVIYYIILIGSLQMARVQKRTTDLGWTSEFSWAYWCSLQNFRFEIVH